VVTNDGDVSEKLVSAWGKANAAFTRCSRLGLLGYVHLKYQHTDNHFVCVLPYHKFILDNADVIASNHAHLKSEQTTSSVRRAGSGNTEVPVWYILSLFFSFFPLVLPLSFFFLSFVPFIYSLYVPSVSRILPCPGFSPKIQQGSLGSAGVL